MISLPRLWLLFFGPACKNSIRWPLIFSGHVINANCRHYKLNTGYD